MRSVLTFLIFIHGAIHLLGLARFWGLGSAAETLGKTLVPLHGATARVFGGLWLFSCLLFLVTAVLFALGRQAFPTVAFAAVLLSQTLVIVAFADAKFGTIGNLMVLVLALVTGSEVEFERRVDQEVKSQLERAAPLARGVVTARDLEALPAPVERWLARAGVAGKNWSQSARIEQLGEIRTSPDAAWMATTAEQHFTTNPPSFVWRVRTSMFGVPISGRDRYADGEGNMLILAAGFVSIADARGAAVDQGSLLRYLGELVWIPSAALGKNISWSAIDDTHARATLHDEALSVSATFRIDARGRVVGLEAERYLGDGDAATLTPWLVECSDWDRFDGVEVPTRGKVSWNLPSGAFTYYRWQVTRLVLDQAEQRSGS